MSLHVDQCRHLSAALAYSGRNGLGSCVLRSVALALDLPAAVLTFGTVRAANEAEIATIPNASLVPFIHCWLELRRRRSDCADHAGAHRWRADSDGSQVLLRHQRREQRAPSTACGIRRHRSPLRLALPSGTAWPCWQGRRSRSTAPAANVR